MKRKRALLFTTTVVLVLCAACGVWLHVQRQQYDRNRALIDALMHKDTNTALALLNRGADPNTRYFPTPAPTLPQLLKHLLRHTPPLANDSSTALMLACMINAKTTAFTSGNTVSEESTLTLLRAMLSHGANVNAGAGNAGTALNYAVYSQNPRIVELLLQHGADANIPYSVGRTPLMWAARMGTTNIARLLLAHGANPNAQDKNGNAVLFYAETSPITKNFIPELLAHGADPNLPNKQGRTPLQIAQRAKRSDLVRLMKGGAGQ